MVDEIDVIKETEDDSKNVSLGPEFEIESEWRRVEVLLARQHTSAWAMAVVEAHKIFRQVLDEVSFGETVDEQIHNAGELFKNMHDIVAADEVYRQILDKVGYKLTKQEAKSNTDALLQAVLDMVGRDFEQRSFWQRLSNSLNFFWGHHPRVLIGLLAGLLAFVVAVWFLADTTIGQWIVDLIVGFSRFVLSWTVLVVLLLVALLIAVALSFVYLEKRRNK